MTHTPTPWHIGMKPGPIAYGPKGEQVADCMNVFLEPRETKANAALIVKAVNSYEAMKEALESVPLPSTHGTPADYYQRVYDWLPIVSHALTLAEGKE